MPPKKTRKKSCKTAACRAARRRKQEKQLQQLPKKHLKQLAKAGQVPVSDTQSKATIANMFLDQHKKLTDVGAVLTPLSLGLPRDYHRNLQRARLYNFREGQRIRDPNDAMCTLIIEQVHLDKNVATMNKPIQQSVVRIRVPCKMLMTYCKQMN